MKILIADDDATTRRTVGNALRKEGWEMFCAADGESAWSLLCREQVHVVISDWNMPGLDGSALCRRIRAAHSPLYTYFLMISGANLSLEDGREALRAGVDGFLAKPFDLSHLVLCVHAARRMLAYANRLHELEGIIPVCSFCRRLRGDGEAYLQMETYFERRAGVVFSHGLCPSCMAEHYPAQADPDVKA